MKIWLDGDACPKKAKEILYKAAIRTQIELIVVANRMNLVPNSKYITTKVVSSGFDEADKYIEASAASGDLVITSDIPLAALVVNKGCVALNQRGVEYNANSINQQLAVRNLMSELRDQNMISGGLSGYTINHAENFANQLDRLLTKLKPKGN